nr:phosphoglycerate kinase, cytosolic-like isoform X1 [Tanacetum cinerariifolium]
MGKVVLVRFDSNVVLGEKQDKQANIFISALSTINYLHEAGAKVILISSWSVKTNSKLHSPDSVSAYMSSILKLKVVPMKSKGYELPKMEDSLTPSVYLFENLSKFKKDLANSSNFSEELCSGVDIFVNDAFFQSHKVLASTVGVTSFCYASVAGFQFEEGLVQLKKAFGTKSSPYIAIVGGGNLVEKAAAVHYLISSTDGLIFVGNMAFQIMHALGLPVPRNLVEAGAFKEAIKIIQYAKSRNIPILLPKDFWCLNDHHKEPQLVPAHCFLEGWSPVALGPNSLEDITTLLSKSMKIVWIGPVKFGLSVQDSYGTSTLATLLGRLSQGDCDVTVVGNMACKALVGESTVILSCNVIENAAVVWEFLKGRKLPGLLALDKGYPYRIDWHAIYDDPTRPLLVDIGSGINLSVDFLQVAFTALAFKCFHFQMCKLCNLIKSFAVLLGSMFRKKHLSRERHFKTEITMMLVKRGLEAVHQSGLKNGYFIETNATSTFRSIVSSYPGKLVLASIQCPNPDFNKPEHRWKMVQRSLIEAIEDMLFSDGKVFLQSDIEAVALRMKQQFLKHKFTVDHQEEWLMENPFGVQSDWEQHVLGQSRSINRKVRLKGKGKGNGKGPQNSYPTKPQKPQPYKKERPKKDGQCHHCKEEGHWKRNCPVYLAELMKKKKKTGGQNVASTSSDRFSMALNNAQTKTNSSAFRSMLEKHQLTGPNFNEWFRALKLVVRTEKLHDVFETALPPAPAAGADAQALAD